MIEDDPGEMVEQVHPFDVGWRERVVVLGTMLVILLLAAWWASRRAPTMLSELTTLVPMTFFAVGKFLPLWSITGESSFGPYQLGAVIWAMDTATVLIFVYSFEAIYRISFLRTPLDRINHNMGLVLDVYPRMKRASVVGVILFVLFPVSGTGALAASFIGILLGMNRFVLIAAVSFGGCLGGFLMGFLTANFASALANFETVQNNPTTKYLIIGITVALLGTAVYFLNRAFRRVLREAEASRSSLPEQ